MSADIISAQEMDNLFNPLKFDDNDYVQYFNTTLLPPNTNGHSKIYRIAIVDNQQSFFNIFCQVLRLYDCNSNLRPDGTISFVVETHQLEVKRFTLAEAEGCLNDETGFWQTCFFVSWPVEFKIVLDVASRRRDIARYSVIILYGESPDYSKYFRIAHGNDIITIPLNNAVLPTNLLAMFPLCVDDGYITYAMNANIEGMLEFDEPMWRDIHFCIPRGTYKSLGNRAIMIRTGHYLDSPLGVDTYKWNGIERSVKFPKRPSLLPHTLRIVSSSSILHGIINDANVSTNILPIFPQEIKCWQRGPLEQNTPDPMLIRFLAALSPTTKVVYQAGTSWEEFRVSLIRGFYANERKGDFGPGLYLYEDFNEVRPKVDGGGYVAVHNWSDVSRIMTMKTLKGDEWIREVNAWEKFGLSDGEDIIPSLYNVDFICGASVPKTHDSRTLDFSYSEDDESDLGANDRFDATTTRDFIEQTNVSQQFSSQSALGEFDTLTNVATSTLQRLSDTSFQYCGISAAAYRFAAETLLGVFYVGPGQIKSRAVGD